MAKLDYVIVDLLESTARNIKAQPVNLGGVAGGGGGVGGPPGGFIGWLPQTRVAYDTDEISSSGITGSGTLLDNLNHIRYRIQNLESGMLVVDEFDGSPSVSNVNRITFSGGVSVTDAGGGRVIVNITASGGGGGGIPEAPTDGNIYGRQSSAWTDLDGTYLRLDASNNPLTNFLGIQTIDQEITIGVQTVAYPTIMDSPGYVLVRTATGAGPFTPVQYALAAYGIEISDVHPYITYSGGTLYHRNTTLGVNLVDLNPYVGANGDMLILDSYNDISTNGTLISLRNQTVEKFSVDGDGNVNIPTGAEYRINDVPIGGGNGGDGWNAGTGTWTYSSGLRSQAYTNDPAAGAGIVLNMADTSGLQVGDPVTVSSSAGSEATYIIAIVANTSITVANLTLNHTTTSPLVTLNETTYIISVNADMTGLIGAGDRIKITQTTTKYFIVTAVGAYSGGATLITVFGGTDYTLANAAITSPYYSHVKNPFGFPTDPLKWAVTFVDTSERLKSSPAQAIWYWSDLGSMCIAAPIGAWNVSITGMAWGTSTASRTQAGGQMALSTSNSGTSDAEMQIGAFLNAPAGTLSMGAMGYKEKPMTFASKTTLYLIGQTFYANMAALRIYGSIIPTTIRLISAYL